MKPSSKKSRSEFSRSQNGHDSRTMDSACLQELIEPALEVLLRNTGRPVSYEQMIAEAWKGTHVSKHTVDVTVGEVKKTLGEYYRVGIDSALKVSERTPYRIGVPFIWCSNNLTVALATQVILYERMTGDRRYRAFAMQHIDWILGRNPWGFAMVTGIPKDGVTPRDVHIAPNAVLKRAVRGGLVDGPVDQRIFEALKGITIRQPDPLAQFQDERAVYHDDVGDYATNEPTMDGTASAILLWALAARY